MPFNEFKTDNRHLFLLGCVSLLVALSWLPYLQIMFHSASYGDEGFVSQSAYRIFKGEVPYLDFFNAITPGSFYWTAIFMKIFGPTFLSVRISLLVSNVLIVFVCCLIAYQYKIRSMSLYAVILTFLAYFGGPYWFIASHHWTALAFCLVSFSLLTHALNHHLKSSTLILAGLFAALCAFTMQHLGAAWLLSASLGLLFLQKSERKKSLLLFWGGFATFALPVALAFISVVGMDVLIYDLITFPLTRYHNLQGHQGISLAYLGQMWDGLLATLQYRDSLEGSARIAARSFGLVGIGIVYILPYLGAVALAFLWKTAARQKPYLALLTAFFVSQYLTALSRWSDTTLVFAAPGALLVLIVTMDNIRRNKGWFHFGSRLEKSWIFLFGGVAIFGCIFHTIAQKAVTVTPAGPVYSLYAGEQQTLQGLLQFFQMKDSNDAVFVYPYAPMLYFLFHTDNPTPYDTLTYPIHTDLQLNKAEALLDANRVRWVIATAQIENDNFGIYLKNNFKVNRQLKYATILSRGQSPSVATPPTNRNDHLQKNL